jgi:hypothetical protein
MKVVEKEASGLNAFSVGQEMQTEFSSGPEGKNSISFVTAPPCSAGSTNVIC